MPLRSKWCKDHHPDSITMEIKLDDRVARKQVGGREQIEGKKSEVTEEPPKCANRTSQPGIRTTNAHTNATLEKQNKLPTVQLMLFCRLSDIVAHPVGTGSTSNNSRSWISCLVESLHVQLEQGSTSDNFRSWTQVLLISLVTTLCNSQFTAFRRYL